MKWMRDPFCPLPLNDPTFDVVSLDIYNVPFSSIQHHYDWLISSIPEQQIALVPGTYYERDGPPTASYSAALRLLGYFDYANRMNQQCDNGYGRVGRTGNYDGCKVWIVAGWSAIPEYVENGTAYVGLLDPRAAIISSVWRRQLSRISAVATGP